MAEPLGIYPLATTAGEAIPYEIIRPLGLIRQDFTDVASGAVTIPAAAELLAIFATNDCIIRFSNTAIYPANGAHELDSIYIPARTYMNVDHNGAASFSVLGLVDAGVVFVITVTKWKDLRKFTQYQRG